MPGAYRHHRTVSAHPQRNGGPRSRAHSLDEPMEFRWSWSLRPSRSARTPDRGIATVRRCHSLVPRIFRQLFSASPRRHLKTQKQDLGRLGSRRRDEYAAESGDRLPAAQTALAVPTRVGVSFGVQIDEPRSINASALSPAHTPLIRQPLEKRTSITSPCREYSGPESSLAIEA